MFYLCSKDFCLLFWACFLWGEGGGGMKEGGWRRGGFCKCMCVCVCVCVCVFVCVCVCVSYNCFTVFVCLCMYFTRIRCMWCCDGLIEERYGLSLVKVFLPANLLVNSGVHIFRVASVSLLRVRHVCPVSYWFSQGMQDLLLLRPFYHQYMK
jgi:hypothetical protein